MRKLRTDEIDSLIDYIEAFVEALVANAQSEDAAYVNTQRQALKEYLTELVGE